jgi:hypothetical protein
MAPGFFLQNQKSTLRLKLKRYANSAGIRQCRAGEAKRVVGSKTHWCFVLGIVLAGSLWSIASHAQTPPRGTPSAKLLLIQALVCDDVKDGIPVTPAIVFSISAGKIYCYSLFDQIAEDTIVYHHWFFRDKPSARIRLNVRPPRWTTFSSIQLREADKGPWRVEISDGGGRILKTVRFSVTD